MHCGINAAAGTRSDLICASNKVHSFGEHRHGPENACLGSTRWSFNKKFVQELLCFVAKAAHKINTVGSNGGTLLVLCIENLNSCIISNLICALNKVHSFGEHSLGNAQWNLPTKIVQKLQSNEPLVYGEGIHLWFMNYWLC